MAIQEIEIQKIEEKLAGLLEKAEESVDPWKHRSKFMRCSSCMWFVEKVATTPTNVGRCRKHAPSMGGYPVVYQNDWCGDHRVDETKQ